jgi:hypothetical protein
MKAIQAPVDKGKNVRSLYLILITAHVLLMFIIRTVKTTWNFLVFVSFSMSTYTY